MPLLSAKGALFTVTAEEKSAAGQKESHKGRQSAQEASARRSLPALKQKCPGICDTGALRKAQAFHAGELS